MKSSVFIMVIYLAVAVFPWCGMLFIMFIMVVYLAVFPWCGMLFDTQSLEVRVDYSRYSGLGELKPHFT